MHTIKTLNKISDIVFNKLPANRYEFSDNADNPEAILVRSADMHSMQISDETLAIARAGAGVNNIPIDECSKRGIVVFNTPGANANAVSELVIAGMLIASRDIVGGINWVNNLENKTGVAAAVEKGKSAFVGPELRGKKLGVIGLGAIGAIVANSAHGMGMEVIGYDPFISVDSAWSLSRAVGHAQSNDEIIENCDFISVHVPLMPQTREMFSEDVFARMKDGAVLLNFSRAELVSAPAVKAALASGKLRKYVTDFPTDDIIGVEGIINIPHLGASTPESEENCASMAAEQLRNFLEHGDIKNSVNFPECVLPRTEAWRVTVVHRNQPGIVANITSQLSSCGINIANMINKSRGNVAYTVLDLDEQLPQYRCDAINTMENVMRVRILPGNGFLK